MDFGDWLGVVSIVLAVVGIIVGVLFAKRVRSRRQIQKIGRGGVGIQSGRDTHIDS